MKSPVRVECGVSGSVQYLHGQCGPQPLRSSVLLPRDMPLTSPMSGGVQMPKISRERDGPMLLPRDFESPAATPTGTPTAAGAPCAGTCVTLDRRSPNCNGCTPVKPAVMHLSRPATLSAVARAS